MKREISEQFFGGNFMLTDRFQDAFSYACYVHTGHTRKGTKIPYISHLMSVAALTLEFGGDEDDAIAALLHDAVEDGGGKPVLEAIRGKFGNRVANIVDGCSDTDQQPKPPWKKRKEEYISHISKADKSTLLVSACDKLHNARSIFSDFQRIGHDIWKRFNNSGRADTLWYYRSLLQAYLETKMISPDLLDELDRTLTEIERVSSPSA